MREDKFCHNDYNPSKDKLEIGGMIVGRLLEEYQNYLLCYFAQQDDLIGFM